MMKPYKGIVRITCTGKTCKDKLKEPVAECVNCDQAVVEVVDFDYKVIAKKKAVPAKRRKTVDNKE